MDYLVVLFKNKEKKKIINKFKTEKKAISFYNKLIEESDKVIFNKEMENGKPSYYEIGLLQSKIQSIVPLFIKDEIGRQIKVELDDTDYKITKIQKYNIEELILDCSNNKKITSQQFISKYLNRPGLKMLSKLNNKIVLQNEDKINLFTFKSIDDSDRFIDVLIDKFNNDGKKDCLFIKDFSTIQRKYLYALLVDQGFSKHYLQRYSTTFPSKK
jgi:hypothetical protein